MGFSTRSTVNVDVNPAKKMLMFIMKKAQTVRNAMRFDSVLTTMYCPKSLWIKRNFVGINKMLWLTCISSCQISIQLKRSQWDQCQTFCYAIFKRIFVTFPFWEKHIKENSTAQGHHCQRNPIAKAKYHQKRIKIYRFVWFIGKQPMKLEQDILYTIKSITLLNERIFNFPVIL